MTFFSLTFLLCFLPVCLLIYYSVPSRFRNLVLLSLSLLFYLAVDASNLWLLLLSVLFDYAMAVLMHHSAPKSTHAKLALAASVLKTLGLAFYCMMRQRMGMVAMPVGVLVYTLSATGYVVDLYEGEEAFEYSFVRFLLYNCFFGRILMGPYMHYSLMRPSYERKGIPYTAISSGMTLLIHGIAKKMILADNLWEAYEKIAAIERRDMTALSAWLLLIYFALGLYMVLDAYSDIARGIGSLFGFKFARNVYYPLHVRCVGEFTARLNSTFFSYLRRYVYQPLGGSGYGVLSDCCNTMLLLMLYGAWMALTPNCVFWGACLGILMLAERYLYNWLLKKLPVFFCQMYAYLAILLPLCLPATQSLTEAKILWGMLFAFKSGMLWNDPIIYIFLQHFWMLIPALLISLPVIPRLAGAFKKHFPILSETTILLGNVALLGLSMMFLV